MAWSAVCVPCPIRLWQSMQSIWRERWVALSRSMSGWTSRRGRHLVRRDELLDDAGLAVDLDEVDGLRTHVGRQVLDVLGDVPVDAAGRRGPTEPGWSKHEGDVSLEFASSGWNRSWRTSFTGPPASASFSGSWQRTQVVLVGGRSA